MKTRSALSKFETLFVSTRPRLEALWRVEGAYLPVSPRAPHSSSPSRSWVEKNPPSVVVKSHRIIVRTAGIGPLPSLSESQVAAMAGGPVLHIEVRRKPEEQDSI